MTDGAERRAEALPIRRLLALALVRLGWSPETFWRATPSELYAALEMLTGEDRRQSFAAFKRDLERRQA